MMRVGESFCPGILHAVQAKDGLLTRIRVPGGMITPSQLAAIAELSSSFADGHVEFTSRSNLQLRAIQDKHLTTFVQRLDAAGFLPSPQHDRVRNIVTSPFAGLGFGEIVDTRPLVKQLDSRLIQEKLLVGLPPKFSFAIDGGGDWFARDCDDLTLRQVKVHDTSLFHLVVGDTLSGFGVKIDDAVDCLIEAAKVCVEISKEHLIPARGKKIASVPYAMNQLLERLAPLLLACSSPDGSNAVESMPVGVYATSKVGFVSLVPSVPLGRLAAEQVSCVESVATEWGGDIRLAPWRGIVFGAVAEPSISQITAKLEAAGLSSDGEDGYRGIAACAGSCGCDASLADVRRDASQLAHWLADREVKPSWTINFSGCEKRCAMRNGATAEIIATLLGYDLRISGHLIASSCSIESVMDKIVARQVEMPFEVLLCE